MTSDAVAQSSNPPTAPAFSLFDPTLQSNPSNPPRFQRTPPQSSSRQMGLRSGSIGNEPINSGMGSTGFDSTNARSRPSNPSSSPADQSQSSDTIPITAPIDAPIVPPDASLGNPALSDEFAPAPPHRLPRKRKPDPNADPFDPIGLRLGSFIVKPAVEVTGGYNSNPGQTTTPVGSGQVTVAPELHVRSDWSEHELRYDLRGSYTDYPGLNATPSLNQPSLDSRLSGRIDVSRQTRIDLEGRFLMAPQYPNNPDLPAGLKELPLTFQTGVTAGVTHKFNRLEVGASGSFDRFTYADSRLTDGSTVSNADRNYDQYGVKLRGGYEIFPGFKPFVEVGGDRRVHDLPVDFFGVRRDSTGGAASVGSSFEIPRLLTGTLSVGYAERMYHDPTLQNFGGLIADGNLAWTATPLTTVTVSARSTINESTLAGVSGELWRDFGVQLDHSLRRWLIATLKFGYGWTDYVGSFREDRRYAGAAQLTYKMSRDVWLKGEYRHQWQTSNSSGFAYAADIFLLGIRLQR